MKSTRSAIRKTDTVGAIVTKNPGLSRVFEQEQIDYCCGGKKPLETACQEKGLEVESLIHRLEEALAREGAASEADLASLSLTELADHIEQTHHVYLRSELPRLEALTEKVSSVHGEKEPIRPVYSVRGDTPRG